MIDRGTCHDESRDDLAREIEDLFAVEPPSDLAARLMTDASRRQPGAHRLPPWMAWAGVALAATIMAGVAFRTARDVSPTPPTIERELVTSDGNEEAVRPGANAQQQVGDDGHRVVRTDPRRRAVGERPSKPTPTDVAESRVDPFDQIVISPHEVALVRALLAAALTATPPETPATPEASAGDAGLSGLSKPVHIDAVVIAPVVIEPVANLAMGPLVE